MYYTIDVYDEQEADLILDEDTIEQLVNKIKDKKDKEKLKNLLFKIQDERINDVSCYISTVQVSSSELSSIYSDLKEEIEGEDDCFEEKNTAIINEDKKTLKNVVDTLDKTIYFNKKLDKNELLQIRENLEDFI